jgi:hypothetical protein
MKAGIAFAFAASQPGASEVRFVFCEAMDIAASWRGEVTWQVSIPAAGETPTLPEMDDKQVGDA